MKQMIDSLMITYICFFVVVYIKYVAIPNQCALNHTFVISKIIIDLDLVSITIVFCLFYFYCQYKTNDKIVIHFFVIIERLCCLKQTYFLLL